MPETQKTGLDLTFLPRALCAWLICAAALLLCAAVLFASNAAPISKLGCGSSVVSFFAALGAGAAACAGRKEGRFLTGLLTSCALIALLLLTGFLIRGRLQSDALLSVLSFTPTGCMLGALLGAKRRKRGRVRPKRIGK
jgi:hypothetical protein